MPTGGGAPVVLATSPGLAGVFALDGANVYYATDRAVMSVPTAGGTPTQLADTVTQGLTQAMAVDGSNVYWTTLYRNVNKVPKAGGPITTLATMPSPLAGIAVDQTAVYFTVVGPPPGHGAIMKMPIAGGQIVTLASSQCDPYQIALDATRIYWANSCVGAVMKMVK
jgi:hypothetical protein